jgi:hypothetical protein
VTGLPQPTAAVRRWVVKLSGEVGEVGKRPSGRGPDCVSGVSDVASPTTDNTRVTQLESQRKRVTVDVLRVCRGGTRYRNTLGSVVPNKFFLFLSFLLSLSRALSLSFSFQLSERAYAEQAMKLQSSVNDARRH